MLITMRFVASAIRFVAPGRMLRCSDARLERLIYAPQVLTRYAQSFFRFLTGIGDNFAPTTPK